MLVFCACADVTADSRKPADVKSQQRGYYAGVGLGTFVAANKFKVNGENYVVAAKPKAHPAVMPSLILTFRCVLNSPRAKLAIILPDSR